MGQGHAGKGKPSKLAFVGDGNMLMTTGFSTTGQRQFALWDTVSIYANTTVYNESSEQTDGRTIREVSMDSFMSDR